MYQVYFPAVKIPIEIVNYFRVKVRDFRKLTVIQIHLPEIGAILLSRK